MIKKLYLSILALCLLCGVFFVSCSSRTSEMKNEIDSAKIENSIEKAVESNKTEEINEAAIDLSTLPYICPNRCSGGDEITICPKCGMEYIENLDYKKEK